MTERTNDVDRRGAAQRPGGAAPRTAPLWSVWVAALVGAGAAVVVMRARTPSPEPVMALAEVPRPPAPTPCPSSPSPPPRERRAVPAPSAPKPPPTDGKAESMLSWTGNKDTTTCFVDADDDGVPELVGVGSNPRTSLLAISLKDGRIVWTTPTQSFWGIYCDGKRGIVRQDDDNTMLGLRPKDGSEAWRVKLSDKLGSVAFGDGCVVFRSIDGATLERDAATGEKRACPRPGAPMKPDAIARAAEDGDVAFTADKGPGPGTPRVVVRARRRGAVLWQTTLPEADAMEEPLVAATGGHAFAAGKAHGASGFSLSRLDAKTGAIELTQTKDVGEMAYPRLEARAGVVVLEFFGGLKAYDAETLEPIWSSRSSKHP